MGSWGSGAAEDNSVGPIVWVRRRNGSWWPGKIMESQELQECNLSSPRTGTPVKLLGREDASVDWYNLEKSKRVKSFRCGDFDNCIERAESAQGMPIKKREKYARREDAILHALELEKQLGLQVRKSSDRIRSKSTGSTKRELGTFSENLGNNNGNPGNAKSDHFLREAGTDMRDDLGDNLNTISGTRPIWEDDYHEATPRMRGLQDLGLKTTPLKRKLSSSFDLDGSGKPIADDYSQDFPNGASSMQRTTHANVAEQRPPMYRAKRSSFVYLPPEFSDSMDDEELYSRKRRVSPSQFGDSDFHPRSLSLNEENSSSEFVDNDESDSSETSSSESETDSSETEPDIDKEMVVYSDAAVHTDTEQDILRLGHPEAPLEHGSTSTEESEGSAFSGDTSLLYPGDPVLANEAVSKWQLKGKRNIRHLTKDYADTDYVRDSDRQRVKRSGLGQRAYSLINVNRKYAGTKMVGLNYASYPYASRFSSKGRNDVGHDEMDWDDMAWENRFVYGGYWEDGAENFNPTYIGRRHFGGRMESALVDVDLKVQASYQKKDVPIMSLTSNLNGMAIIGHPIQIEPLEDGSSEPLIHTNDYYGNGIADHDGTTSLPVWRTARRTNLRVPRPDLSSVLGSYAAAGDITSTDHERRPPFKKSGAGNFGHKASSARKCLSHIPRPPADREKVVKKVSSPSNRKTRTLSSITKPLHDVSDSKMGGILKPETSRPTTVACIPVKLVFSRLLEKINRPPSKATTNVVLSNRNADRQTS